MLAEDRLDRRRLELVDELGRPAVCDDVPDPEQLARVAAKHGIEILEPDAEYWLADTALQQPTRVLESVDLRITYATALMSPEAIATPLLRAWARPRSGSET